MPISAIWMVLACSGEPPPGQAPVAATSLDAGWIGQLLAEPSRFGALVDGPGREGWIAFHGADWTQASIQLPTGPGAARAWLEIALLHEDLSRVASLTWPRLADGWIAQDPRLADSPLPLLAALAEAEAGQAEAARRRAATLSALDQRRVELVLEPKLEGAPPAPPGGLDPMPCLEASLAFRSGAAGPPEPGCSRGDPVFEDPEHVFYDPLIFGTTAQVARDRAQELLGAGGLASQKDKLETLAFGPWWGPEDLLADLARDPSLATAGAEGPTLEALGLPDTGTEDAPEAARQRVRALDAALDAWVAGQQERAGDDGRALLDDLRLVAITRNRILIAWARQALAQDRPHQATATLQLAHDVEHAREIGPLNPPSLFVLQAEAALRTGRTREALDALSVLETAWPIVGGLDETVGDLAVLEGIGRQGDSKEH